LRVDKECAFVFPTRDGNQYTDEGFKSIWQRIVLKAIDQDVIKADVRFTFHDLRAFYATKHKKDRGTLPDLHANPETTARVYDRNKEVGRRSF
jgi:integrase